MSKITVMKARTRVQIPSSRVKPVMAICANSGGLVGDRDRQIQELTGQPSQAVSQVGEG